MDLSGVDRFEEGPGHKKYSAILKNGRRVSFGDRRYQHYQDSVPVEMGGGIWSSLDHHDEDRRRKYQQRHSGVKTSDGERAISVRYSPAWFSYYLLW